MLRIFIIYTMFVIFSKPTTSYRKSITERSYESDKFAWDERNFAESTMSPVQSDEEDEEDGGENKQEDTRKYPILWTENQSFEIAASPSVPWPSFTSIKSREFPITRHSYWTENERRKFPTAGRPHWTENEFFILTASARKPTKWGCFYDVITKKLMYSRFGNKSYISLKFCHIENIECGAFSGLDLESLDLSGNLLRHLHPCMFDGLKVKQLILRENQHLVFEGYGICELFAGLGIHELDLSRNNFKSFPLCVFDRLEANTIILSNSQIIQFLREHKYGVESFNFSLRYMDLSNNFLDEYEVNYILSKDSNNQISFDFSKNSIIHLKGYMCDHPKTVKLHDNPINCDCELYDCYMKGSMNELDLMCHSQYWIHDQKVEYYLYMSDIPKRECKPTSHTLIYAICITSVVIVILGMLSVCFWKRETIRSKYRRWKLKSEKEKEILQVESERLCDQPDYYAF